MLVEAQFSAEVDRPCTDKHKKVTIDRREEAAAAEDNSWLPDRPPGRPTVVPEFNIELTFCAFAQRSTATRSWSTTRLTEMRGLQFSNVILGLFLI